MFARLSCPFCGVVAITPMDKILLSPQSSRTCGSCGKHFGTSWLTLGVAALLTASLAAYFIYWHPAKDEYLAIAGLALVVFSVIKLVFIPLRQRSS